MKLRLVVVLCAGLLAGALALGPVSLANRGGPAVHARKAAPLFAVLTGRNEISATTGRRGAGDPDGIGSATVLLKRPDTVCFGITVAGLDQPILAHIHSGPRGVNGPIVVPLDPPSSGDPGTSSGCKTGVDSALVQAIRRHPRQYYVNVHTTAFPAGAVRGQLFRVHAGR